MMDLSYWTQLNPKVKCEPTRKQFYSQYLCKLVVDCPAGRLINDDEPDLKFALRQRVEEARWRNHGGSWAVRNNKELDRADIDLIMALVSIKKDYPEVRFRVEEPLVQIYTVDEDALKVIAGRIPAQFSNRIESVQVPASDAQAALLKENKILVSSTSRVKFKYKIYFRDGNYPVETKRQVLTYLQNLGDEVQTSPGTMQQLDKGYEYTWGCFVYANDPNVLTFLNLICPRLIAQIHELTLAD